MLALLLFSLAQAGEIRVETYEPVLIQVNARVRELDEESHSAWAHELRPGASTVRILDPQGRVVAEEEYAVGAHERVRLAYIDEALVITRRHTFEGDRTRAKPALRTDPEPVEATPIAAPEPVGPRPMAEARFGTLMSTLKDASFPGDKRKIVDTAAATNHFTIAQLTSIFGEFAHSSDRVKVAKMVAPKIVDPENAFLLEKHLTFASEKEEILGLFR